MNNRHDNYPDLGQSGIKLIRSLQQKKIRDKQNLFVAEGDKICQEYIHASEENRCTIKYICATADWLEQKLPLIKGSGFEIFRIDYKEIKRISSFVNPQEVMAVVEKKQQEFKPALLKKRLTLAFDSIRDPGNFGTIIRTADWFGIETVICSPDSVDVFNPKVIQSAMGSTLRVNVHYEVLAELFSDAAIKNIPVYGTFMEGNDIYTETFPEELIILFGNESAGIDSTLLPLINHKISIPEFPAGKLSTESLNVATAMAIISSEVRRSKR